MEQNGTWDKPDKLFFIGMCHCVHCVQVGRVRSSASRDGAWEQNQHCQDEAEDMEAGCSCGSVVGQIWMDNLQSNKETCS